MQQLSVNDLNLPTRSHVLAAVARIARYANVTPVIGSRERDVFSRGRLFFKAEHLQRSGAFKFRGLNSFHEIHSNLFQSIQNVDILRVVIESSFV